MTGLAHVPGIALAGVWTLAVLWAGYLVALRLAPSVGPGLRCTATGIACGWLLGAIFYALSPVAAFSRLGVSAGLVLLVALLHRHGGSAAWARLRDDLQSARLAASRSRGSLVALGGLLALLAGEGPRLVRAMIAPLPGWDALTYHLFRAGRWVQEGGLVFEPTPDAGGYYAYYPPLGDIWWSWFMLPAHGEALLAIGGWFELIAVFFAMVLAAKALGAPSRVAPWAALALVATPAVSAWWGACYVDSMVLATALAAIAWLPTALADPRPGHVALCAAALGMIAGIKTTGVVVAGTGVLAIVCAVALRVPKRQWPVTCAALAGALCVGSLGYAIAWIEHGNPLYPFPLRLWGDTLLAGNPENEMLHRGALFPPHLLEFSLPKFLHALFGTRSAMWTQHLNFGPAGLLGLPLLAGAWNLLFAPRSSGLRGATLVLLLILTVFGLKLTSGETLVLRTLSAQGIGRFLSVPFAVLLLFGTRLSPRFCIPIFAVMTFTGAWLLFPRGWGTIDTLAAKETTLRLAAGGAVAAMLVFVWRRSQTKWRTGGYAAACALVGLTTLASIVEKRRDLRVAYLREAAAGHTYDPHPLDAKALDAWPIWQWLDDEPPRTVAFASGWDGKGHHWYRSPLLGADLQHRVVYVSPVAGPELIDYRLHTTVQEHADFSTWLRRLAEAEVDVLVLGTPPSIEHAWVERARSTFEPIVGGPHRQVIAFRMILPSVERHE